MIRYDDFANELCIHGNKHLDMAFDERLQARKQDASDTVGISR